MHRLMVGHAGFDTAQGWVAEASLKKAYWQLLIGGDVPWDAASGNVRLDPAQMCTKTKQ